MPGCWFNRTELEERTAFREQVYKLFWGEKFDELEKLSNELRSTKERFPGGSWKLPWVYYGFMPKPKPWPKNYCYNWNGCLDRFDHWRAKYPHSITARIGVAWLNVQLAWAYRQGYPIEKISEENRALYYSRLAVAQSQLDEARAAGALCPEFFDTYLAVGYSLGWDKRHMDDLFAEAVAFEPEYYSIYLSRTQWYFMGPAQPDSMSWEEFINLYTSALPEDDGALIYAYTVWSLYDGYFGMNDKVSWPKLRHGFNVMEKRYPGSIRVHNAFCRFAYEARDKATARRLFSIPDLKYDRDIWSMNRVLFREAMKWAMTGPVGTVEEYAYPEPLLWASAASTAIVSRAVGTTPMATETSGTAEEVEAPALAETNTAVTGENLDGVSPEEWNAVLAEVQTSGVMKQRGKYIALVNGQVVRPGDIVPVRRGHRVFRFTVKEITACDCRFEPAGLEKEVMP